MSLKLRVRLQECIGALTSVPLYYSQPNQLNLMAQIK